ncbi:hypothetical protein Esi_0309_0042 [Ectocarpus siliculosus]|uniref:Arrestin-like N-terminal domain-containing protein n=1 Tax=Ectocarpus siliculosus TaxID=2880 RepID=D7FWP7_ECTSI|nr:hypothetical protein Esi_0309_0042 [Ectocarpus siliculosus]|eukprot:CBJ32135.1 hypothetical protein Esi_0309_0042 [Ectocarpus siliculosus]
MGPIKLKVSTLQHQYFAGSVVKGSVEVQVCTKNNKESSADELKLRLVGHVKTAVDYSTDKGEETKMAREDKEILSYDVQLGSFGGKAASGVHNFLFSVTLPAGLPPSMTVSPILTVGAGGTEVQPGGGSVVLAQAAPCPSPQTMPYPAGPTQPSPYLAPQTPQYSTGPYGSAQTVPYPTPQGATYGAPPEASLGYTPGIQCYPTHQAVAAVKVDENGRVIPRVVPHGGG